MHLIAISLEHSTKYVLSGIDPNIYYSLSDPQIPFFVIIFLFPILPILLDFRLHTDALHAYWINIYGIWSSKYF